MSCTTAATGKRSPAREVACARRRATARRRARARVPAARSASRCRAMRKSPSSTAAIAARRRRPTCCPSLPAPGIPIDDDDPRFLGDVVLAAGDAAARGGASSGCRVEHISNTSWCTDCCIFWAIDHGTDQEAQVMESSRCESRGASASPIPMPAGEPVNLPSKRMSARSHEQRTSLKDRP